MSRSPSLPPRNTVALAADDRMVYGLIVLASALIRTARVPFRLVVGYFPSALSEANRELLSEFLSWQGVEYRFIESKPNELFTERRHLTITTFLKFVISDSLTEPHLWIDVDTMVRPGWDDIFNTINAASQEIPLVVAKKIESPHTRFEGFNAGVLGWTSAPRKAWVAGLRELPEKRFSSEQYLLNRLYGDDMLQVECTYNFLSSWHKHIKDYPDPRIIHYSGPVKPWHLARRHVPSWRTINPTWDYWFEAEQQFLDEISPSPVRPLVLRKKRRALFSGRLHSGKGAVASWIMRVLAIVGPFGTILVRTIQRRYGR